MYAGKLLSTRLTSGETPEQELDLCRLPASEAYHLLWFGGGDQIWAVDMREKSEKQLI